MGQLEVRPAKVCADETTGNEIRLPQIGIAETGTGEIGPDEVSTGKTGVGEVGIGEISVTEASTNKGAAARSGTTPGFPSRQAFHASTPFRKIARCSSFAIRSASPLFPRPEC
jgi:hypothetical protein